jgi:hypothetical protein
MSQNVIDTLADVIRAWAADKPKYTAVPTNAELAADLDFVTACLPGGGAGSARDN